MTFTVEDVSEAIKRVAAGMKKAAPELNELDGRLGDGDLGATLEKCADNIMAALDKDHGGVDKLFKACQMACVRASGSSFGTLMGVAFQAAADKCAGEDGVKAARIAPLLKAVLEALMARGGASLGDKTMLDSLDAIERALAKEANPASMPGAAVAAARAALDNFRDKPNKIGRARMFADRSVGMDDPGMVAVLRMVEAMKGGAR